jgi:hypothetical protein
MGNSTEREKESDKERGPTGELRQLLMIRFNKYYEDDDDRRQCCPRLTWRERTIGFAVFMILGKN